ncbi:unnamed protein product [Larinioides sclopetarius]|uniref:Secreted protein n=1 Tax=Larinioides sclopetarius TaxID=280406 RepID=A0AAV2BJC6_9ARAC
MILLIKRRSGSAVLATRFSSSFSSLKFFCNLAMCVTTSSLLSFSLRKNCSMRRSSRCPELCSYTDSSFSQILLALSHVAVSSTLASSILPTRTS